MNRSIITLKEMINICKKTQQTSASQMLQVACSTHRVLIALLLITIGVGSAWAQDPVFSTWNGTVPAIPANTNVATVNAAGITGAGTEANPFLIDSADDFVFFWAAACNGKISSSAQYWRLDANIDLDNQTWTYVDKNGTFKGKFDGNGKIIKNMTLTTNAANKNFGLFQQIQGENATKHAEIKNLTIQGFTISTPDKNTNYGSTTNVGLLVGKLNGNVDIQNVTVSGGTIAYNVTTTGANYVGCLAGQITNDNNTVTGCTVNNGAAITTASGDDAAKKNNFLVGGLAGNVSNNTLIKGNTITVSITLNGETSGNNYAGGLIGYASGSNSTVTAELPMGKRIVIQGNTVTSSITMNGVVTSATLSVGGFMGYVNNHVNVFNNKVTTPNISVTNDINNNSYVGGAIGFLNAYSYVDGMTVSGGSISGPSSEDKQVANNKQFFIGGFLGMQNSSNTGIFQPDKFMNIAVSDININLGKYVPSGVINNHKFAVGGIAGSVNAPNKDANGFCGMPENIIFKGGSIYAPYAATSPTVPNFNSGTAAHNNLTTEAVTTIDALDKAKVKTWYYSDYELGLSSEFLDCTKVKDNDATPTTDTYRKNYTATPTVTNGISYITVNNTTFKNQNRYQDNLRDSWTVLWWTNQNSWASGGPTAALFTAEEQPIYPQSNFGTVGTAELTKFPYYMYFYQGVANANYVEDAVATKIIAGIEANKTQAAEANPVILTISNDKENERGFADRTLTVKAVSNETDVTGSYTYQWYVNGEADGTSTTKTLTPHWRDGQGITVNALNGETVVATATYTLAPGVLHTKKSIADASAEAVRSDINDRGTKANPYIIDCENALRQWSYLSTAHTATLWESIIKPVSPFPTNQIAGHYGRAYYELGADITMGVDPFIPISHVGYGADGTYGTYSNNWIFQGNFDGKGYKISGLKITWGAGQYNGNGTNIYYGLFGAVGHSTQTAKWGDDTTLSNTVIKNLIIDGAVLTHDTGNKTFSYKKDYTHITGNNFNNCMVGVLAGIVNDYTTIQNIDIRNSQITDNGSSSYDLATQGLYVGGAIGSVQRDYKTTSTAIASVDIQHIAANVNITLTQAAFADGTAQAQVGLFNVGGIVGRYMATSATAVQMQAVMPKYTIYSGTVNAPKAWISPVIGATRFTGQNGGDYKHFSKQWEGNNADAASQIMITNAQYYNFKIHYDDDDRTIDESYPADKCKLGFRVITLHADGKTDDDYKASEYQGVNYNARYVEPNSTLELLNKERTEGYNFVWDGGVVKMTTNPYVGLTLVRAKDADGNDTNQFTTVMEGETPKAYKWEVKFDNSGWISIDGETGDAYTVPVSLKKKYVRVSATLDGESYPYTTLYEIVEADKELCNPQITKGGTEENPVFSFALNQKSTTPAPVLTATYEWYKTKKESSRVLDGNLSLTKESLTRDYNNVVFCKVSVTELGVEVADYFLVNGATVVYINANNYEGYPEGLDTNNGLTPQTPVLTLDHAYSLLKDEDDGGTVDNNIIVIMGVVNKDNSHAFQSDSEKPATLTGYYDNVDYKGVIQLDQINPDGGGEHVVNPIGSKNKKGSNCYVCGDTKFEKLTFYGNQTGNTFIELHGHDAIFGEGLKMDNFRLLSIEHGNFNESQIIPEFTILLYATNLSEAKIREYTKRIHDGGKPQTVTFQSGRYGRLMAGRFTENFFYGYKNATSAKSDAYSILGSAEYPVWAEIDVEIGSDNPNEGTVTRYEGKTPKESYANQYSCDINAIIAGLTDGSMYGDFTINFRGGNVAYIVGANQGNAVNNGDVSYTPIDGTNGQWGQFPNASYFGRSVINIDQKENIKDITVGNLYAGGLGRKVQNDANTAYAAVDMYVYGQTIVNVKNGTVSGSVYGGGVGGVLGVNPWDAHVPYATTAENAVGSAIHNKVQYGDKRQGSWSSLEPTSEMAKVTIYNLKADGSGYDKDELDLRNTSTTVNVSGGTVNGNVYGGGYGFVQNMPYYAAVQGIGSVFGTANINITGGTINGNIYGGSQGHTYYYNHPNRYGQTINHIAEMNGTVNVNITGTEEKWPTIRGDIYGAGQGIPSSNTEEYNRIATTGNADLGSGNEYKSTVNITIDIPDTKAIEGNVYGGGRMGAVDGDINVVINGGQINGNVYGGGKGEKDHLQKARVNGTTNVKVGY